MTGTTPPLISVVMPVHNAGKQLVDTLASVLSQHDCHFEFVVVDDGSTDESAAILDELAATDPRLRVFHQANAGLTRALMRGCGEARGELIARQDAGDLSLDGRLSSQAALFAEHPDVSLVSCWSETVGPSGEPMYEIRRDQVDCTDSMRDLAGALAGPSHHGSVMFRRASYQAVGGYRPEFYFAQDIDLWLRLCAAGRFLVVPEILYQIRIAADTISGTWRREQEQIRALAAQLAGQRRTDGESLATLAEVAAIRPVAGRRKWLRWRHSQTLYFIGECLRRRGDRRAIGYFLGSVSSMPLQLRSWLRLLQVMLAFGWRGRRP